MVALTDTQYRNIIQTLLHGFGDRRPNPRVAAILTAEANLGMRVGDILRLHMSDIVKDGVFCNTLLRWSHGVTLA